MTRLAFIVLMVSALALALARTDRARGADLYSYDLDSLVFMSEHIVRGTIAQPDGIGTVPANQFIVANSFFGALKPGDSVQVAALDFFAKPRADIRERRKELGQGDEVIAFLVRAKAGFAFDIPPHAVVYMPAPSGLKVLVDGKACGFHQQDNPGPYVMDDPKGMFATPAIATFEKDLVAAIARVRPMADRLSRAPTKTDVPWLLEVLRARPPITEGSHSPRDAIAEAACAKLAELKDLAALDEALQLASTRAWGASTALRRGFASIEGRTLLLKKLSSDPKLPAAKRVLYAQALDDGVWDYQRSATADEKFLAALARLAVRFANEMDEASAHVLLAQLHTSANLHGQSKGQNTNLPPALESDLIASLGMLKSAYPQLRSPQLRFDIDKIMLMARPELGFSSAVGPVATLLTIPRPEQHYASEAGRLTREYEYATGRDTRGRQFEIELIAQDLSTHRRFIIGPRERIEGGMSGGSGSLVPLPPDLPRARYHLFYQAYENGKPVGEGQGVDVDLPPPSTQPTSRGTTTRATTMTTIPSSSR